jgi:hypothetical protein
MRELSVFETRRVSGGSMSSVVTAGALGGIGGFAAGRIATIAMGAAIGGPVGAAVGVAISIGYGFATMGGGGRYRLGTARR